MNAFSPGTADSRPAAGDPAPGFVQRSPQNPRYSFDSAAGRYLVLCFFGSAGDGLAQNALKAVLSRPDLFDDRHASFSESATIPPMNRPGGWRSARRAIGSFGISTCWPPCRPPRVSAGSSCRPRSCSCPASLNPRCAATEYGPRSYKAPVGGAVVFSSSLLHRVSRVTRGRRYAFLPFLYDDAAARLREQNLRYLGDADPTKDAAADKPPAPHSNES